MGTDSNEKFYLFGLMVS